MSDDVTLADWLLERIAEDEAGAEDDQNRNDGIIIYYAEKTLAECEAKRRIVQLHQSPNGTCWTCGGYP